MLTNTHYLILGLLSIFPFIYKYLFWFFVVQLKEYRFDRFYEYIKTPQGVGAIFHIFMFSEIILFFFTIYYLFNPGFEPILYYLFLFVLSLENVYNFYKTLKRQIFIPKFTFRWAFTFIILFLVLFIFLALAKNIYIGIIVGYLFSLLFILLSIFISYPVVWIIKRNKFNKARKVSEKYDKVIKIGITGSYGKTSEKEYIVQFLKSKYKVLATPKNVNTELGVSDVIIKKLNNSYNYFVAEMGAYKIGEIATIGKILGHTYGFITAIGNQHLALFGGINRTMRAKSEIMIEVLKNGGTLYINRDNQYIRELKFYKGLNVVKYGTHKGADARSEIIEIDGLETKFKFSYKGLEGTFKTNLIGEHNIVNITGTMAFCIDIGFTKDEIKSALKDITLPENTLEVIQTKNNIIINDTHNLSEGSLFAGLETMKLFKEKKEKILILDDILELGRNAKEIHYKIAKKIAKKKLATKIVYVGVNYKKEFVGGLLDGGFKMCDICGEINGVNKGDILLFEGRRARDSLNKFLGKKQ